jgi:tetratricopeptide (TPR) repeat protein
VQGNELFKNQDFDGALARNKIALDYVDEELLFQLQGRYLDQAHAVLAPLHLNCAACYLRLQDWSAAAAQASQCLELLGADNADLEPKALFRRAKAWAEMQKTEDALKDLQKAQQM